MFTFWFTYDSNSDSFYNLSVLMFITLLIWFVQLARPASLSRFEIKKTIEVKIIRNNCRKIAVGFGKKRNRIKKNKTDLNKTPYLNIAKIENEWIIRLVKDIFEGWTYLLPLIQGMLSNLFMVFFKVPE